jgi:hypothetical protein
MMDLLIDEVLAADLGDERLNNRLVRIVERFGQAPNLSIPAATTSRAEMEAAYRFFNNEKVSSEKILAPHAAQTLARMAEQSVVVLVQDTTELDLTRPTQPVEDAGPMDSESRRGEFFHPLMAQTVGPGFDRNRGNAGREKSETQAYTHRRQGKHSLDRRHSGRSKSGCRMSTDDLHLRQRQ